MQFSSDFETGNGRLVGIEDSEVHFVVEGKRDSLMLWWHFEVGGVCGRSVTFVLDNAANVLGGLGSLRQVLPVVSFGGKDWYRLPPGEIDEAAGTWRFTVRFPREVEAARLAFCYPYGYTEAVRVAEGWGSIPGTLGLKPWDLRVDTLCTSPGGRAVPVLILGNDRAKGRQMVVACARQHSGETPGSFVLEGFVEAFLAPGVCGKWLREKGLLVVVPMMDVDGAYDGSFGKNQAPVDMNRDWAGESRWPQVRALRGLIRELSSRHDYRLFIDFHAPCAHQPNFVCFAPEETLPQQAALMQHRFAELLEAHQCSWFDFCAADSHVCFAGEEVKGASAVAQAREHGCASVGIETTYHTTREGRVGSPLRYRQHGQAVASAAVALLED